LRDQVYDGEEQKGFGRCAMIGNLRVPVPTLVGPEFSEHLEVCFKHRPRPHSVFSKKLEKL
jgi:hypothetical protein